jgi:hypothetical protein
LLLFASSAPYATKIEEAQRNFAAFKTKICTVYQTRKEHKRAPVKMSVSHLQEDQQQHKLYWWPLAPESSRREMNLAEQRLLACVMQHTGTEKRGFSELLSKRADRLKFQFENSLGRPYDDVTSNIAAVTFDISRYGKYRHTIPFPRDTTEEEAVRAAERFLSQPLTRDYYEAIQDDTFHQYLWEVARHGFTSRGDALTDAKYLEQLVLDPQTGELMIETGS